MITYQELSSIEADLGIPAKTLYRLSNDLDNQYRAAVLPKKNGGSRTLYIPSEALKRVQRAIAARLLPLCPVSPCAKAYRPASSIRSNASPHVGKPYLLKLDIDRFFDSVLYSDVKEKVFPREQYSEPIRILLSMLCYYRDVLPQGAPTSPAISNILLYDFDCAMQEFCLANAVTYTRYSDDITCSGEKEALCRVKQFAEEALRREGFLLNQSKLRLLSSDRRQKVTGLLVNRKLNVPEDYKRKIRTELYFIQKFGIESHLQAIGNASSPKDYLLSLSGRIRFVLSVTPDDARFREYQASVSKMIKAVP